MSKCDKNKSEYLTKTELQTATQSQENTSTQQLIVLAHFIEKQTFHT